MRLFVDNVLLCMVVQLVRLATSVTAYAEVHVDASALQLLHELGSLNPAADAIADEQDFLPMGLAVGFLAWNYSHARLTLRIGIHDD